MKLYVDADITPKLARILHGRGYDILAAQDAGNADASDNEQMAYAAAQGRALLTCNVGDFTAIFEDYWYSGREHFGFTAIFEDYWYSGREHFGVIVSEQLELSEMIRRVARLLDTVNADDMRNNWKNLAEFAH